MKFRNAEQPKHLLDIENALSYGASRTRAQAQQIKENSPQWIELEKELGRLDQQWLEAARHKKLKVLRVLWADNVFEIVPGGQIVTKPQLLTLLAGTAVDPNTGVFADDFKLQAVYPDSALATDHTILKDVIANRHDYSGNYKALRMFVRVKGEWKLAGASFVPMVTK